MKSLLVIGQWGESVVERLSKDLKKSFPDYCDNLLQKFHRRCLYLSVVKLHRSTTTQSLEAFASVANQHVADEVSGLENGEQSSGEGENESD